METVQAILDWFARPWVSNLIAAAALGLAGWAAWASRKANKRIVEIEERREADRIRESQAAMLSAELQRKRGCWVLKITNAGKSTATEVQVSLKGQPLAETRLLDGRVAPDKIGPGDTARIPLTTTLTTETQMGRPPWDITITWVDDSGRPGVHESQLT